MNTLYLEASAPYSDSAILSEGIATPFPVIEVRSLMAGVSPNDMALSVANVLENVPPEQQMVHVGSPLQFDGDWELTLVDRTLTRLSYMLRRDVPVYIDLEFNTRAAKLAAYRLYQRLRPKNPIAMWCQSNAPTIFSNEPFPVSISHFAIPENGRDDIPAEEAEIRAAQQFGPVMVTFYSSCSIDYITRLKAMLDRTLRDTDYLVLFPDAGEGPVGESVESKVARAKKTLDDLMPVLSGRAA